MCDLRLCCTLLFLLISAVYCKKAKEKPEWAKKDITDYTDADLERLLDQWEEDEEPLPDDELPEHLRPMPQIDLSKIDTSNPENILKVSKKGRTLMMFVNLLTKDRDETEDVSKLWQSSLFNNHIQTDRFLIDDKRVIFMFKDGGQAWEAKDFIVDQPMCADVTIENKQYPGKHTEKYKQEKKTEL